MWYAETVLGSFNRSEPVPDLIGEARPLDLPGMSREAVWKKKTLVGFTESDIEEVKI